MNRMTDAGQSSRDPCNLNGVGGSPRRTFNYGSDEATPTLRTSSGINLRRILRVHSWNILSLSENHRLPHLAQQAEDGYSGTF